MAFSKPETENNKQSKSNIFVIAAPSATGKTTLVKMLMEVRGDKLAHGVTATSRAPRPDEIHGEHYYFYPDGEFEQKISEGFFIEWANVHGRKYGLPNHEVARLLQDSQKHPLLVVDVQGLRNLREKLDRNLYSKIVDIFILPPSEEELVRRMRSRGDVDESDIMRRLETMRREMAVSGEFSHKIVNDDLGRAFGELLLLIDSHV
jgi:guanylate kinase